MQATTLIAWSARVGLLPASAVLLIAALPARADETVGVTLADKGMQSMRMDLSTKQVKAGKVTVDFDPVYNRRPGASEKFVEAVYRSLTAKK